MAASELLSEHQRCEEIIAYADQYDTNRYQFKALYLHKTVGDLYSSERMVDVVKKGLNPLLRTYN